MTDPRTQCPPDCPALASDDSCCQQAATALFVDLCSDGTTYGFMCVSAPEGLEVDDQERSLLLEVAGDIAFGLRGIELERRQGRYAQIVASSTEAMALIDPGHTYLEANPSYLRLIAAEHESVVGRRVEDVLGANFFEEVRPRLERCLAGEEVRFETGAAWGPRGRRLDALYTPCRDADGVVTAAAVCIRDITAQRRAEERSRFLSAVVEQTPDGVICTDTDFNITYINRAAERLFGWSLEEVRGQTPGIFNADPLADQMQQQIYETMSRNEVFEGEALNRRKDGSIFACLFRVAPLLDHRGRTVAYMGSQRDVTRRNELEAERQMAQRDTAALLEATRAMLQRNDFRQAARAIFDVCAGHLGAPVGYLALMSEDGQQDELQLVETGGAPSTVDATAPLPIRGLRAEVYEAARAVHDNAFQSSPTAATSPWGSRTSTACSTPR